MENLIILLVLIVIIGCSVGYVHRSRKSGRKCIGCPEGSCHCPSGSGTPCHCRSNTAQCTLCGSLPPINHS